METNDIPNTEVSDWVPMSNPVHLAVLGKAGEELGELISAKDRCIIQGLDGIDPDSGKVNRDWLTDEVADVAAMLLHIARRFNLDSHAIEERKQRKYVYKGKWFDKLQRDLDRSIADIKTNMFSKCLAIQYSDTTVCSACNLVWDTNDTAPPTCPRMETKKRLMGDLADNSHWAPLSTEPVEYVMLLDYPVETIKLMAEQNPNLYIVPFYGRMYGEMGKTSGAMEDVDTWGNIRNVFKPQLLDMSKCPPMGSWQDLARPVVENLLSGLGTLKERRVPPLVQSPPTEPEKTVFEYMIAVDQSREALMQLAQEHPDVYIMPFHTNLGQDSVPKSQLVTRSIGDSDEEFLSELRRLVRKRLVGDKTHAQLIEVVPPVLPATLKAPEPQVIKYMMTVDTAAHDLAQLVKDYPDVYIIPFYTSNFLMPIGWPSSIKVFKPRRVTMYSPSLSRDELLDKLRSVVKQIFNDPPFMIVRPDTQFIEVTPPWELPSKPTEVPETVEWYVGAYVGFNRMRFQYTNHLGVKAQREVRPIKVWFGSTPYHPTSRALLKAYDYDRQGERDFEMGQMREVHWVGASENMRD